MADPAFHVNIAEPKLFSQSQELAIAQAAFAREPESEPLRHRLAVLLSQQNRVAQAVALLQSRPSDDPAMGLLLARSLLTLDGPESTQAALPLAQEQVARARTPASLTVLGRILLRLGDLDGAASLLEEALALNPQHQEALKRLTALYLKQDRADRALALLDRLYAAGVRHPFLFCCRQLALASLGRMADARAVQGLDEFLVQMDPPPPTGWATAEAFHADLAEELLGHPDIRQERRAAGVNQTLVVDRPAMRRFPAILALQRQIASQVKAYVAAHPTLDPRPARGRLRDWCVMAEGAGHEDWHVHQSGWLSGVYYIHVQDHIAQGTGQEGCFAFGIPEKIAGDKVAAAFGQRVVRPHTGLMMIFPSHAYHRTYPHHGEGRRICYSFDIDPGV